MHGTDISRAHLNVFVAHGGVLHLKKDEVEVLPHLEVVLDVEFLNRYGVNLFSLEQLLLYGVVQWCAGVIEVVVVRLKRATPTKSGYKYPTGLWHLQSFPRQM
eukprot:SAG11_NODE_1118_length_5794_cov_8.276032_2_plen_103_part_00